MATNAPNRQWLRRMSPAQVLVLGFLGMIAVGTVLLTLPQATADGRGLSPVDALFMATSATCVTGLVVVDVGAQLSRFGQLVVLALIQLGGLGFMTISTVFALLIGKRITLRERLALQEALGSFGLSGLVRLVRYVLVLTVTLEALGTLALGLYFARSHPPVDAFYLGLFHAVSAFNNAGFSLFSTSLMGFNREPFVLGVILGLFVLGGLGAYVLADLFPPRRPWRPSLHTWVVLVLTGVLLAVGTLMVLALEWANPATLGALDWPARILNALFHAATPRTAGFNTLPVASMGTATLFVTMLLMMIGGSPGGTAGGIKTTTFLLFAAQAWTTVRGQADVVLYERRVPREVVDKSVAIAVLFLAAAGVVASGLALTESAAARDILFETVSALGTVGLSTGLTPNLSEAGRLIVVVAMFCGRVGPVTLAIAVAQRRRVAAMAYAEERVVVG